MNIIVILFAHYLLDYPLQNDFLAKTKGKDWYSLFAHSMIYGLGMSICLYILGRFNISDAFILVGSHFFIDKIKSSAKNEKHKLTTYLYVDQTAHILINLLLLIY